MEWDFLGRSPRKGQPKQGYRDMEWDFAATEIGGCELQILSDNFKKFEKTESIWSSSGAHLDRIGSDRIQLEAASSRYSRKISKNFKKTESIWSSYRWDVPTFWTLSALAYFLFHAILKNKKKKMVKSGRLMVYHFWNKFTIYSAQKARHLKNRSFERIYVQNCDLTKFWRPAGRPFPNFFCTVCRVQLWEKLALRASNYCHKFYHLWLVKDASKYLASDLP